MQVTDDAVGGQPPTPENSLDIAGFKTPRDPRDFPNYLTNRTQSQSDEKSLAKLHYCGLDVASLDEADARYKISPLRTDYGIYGILGHAKKPVHTGTKDPWFTEDHLTSLAFQFPNPTRKGEVYPHTRIVRVRYCMPLRLGVKNKKTGKSEIQVRKYDQPSRVTGDSRSTSEPYFLVKPDMWVRVFDMHRPLYITESELKAVAIGLTGLACIGFSGANMWGAPKGKKHQLHPALDPNGPWGKGRTIPITGRQVVVIFDNDPTANALVQESAKNLAKALLTAGAASVRIARLPTVMDGYAATGPDDFLHHHLGPRWAGAEDKIAKGRELVEELAAAGDALHSLTRYKAYSIVRSGERLREKLSTPSRFAYYETTHENADVCLRVYDGVEYLAYDVAPTVGSTSGKVVVADVMLQQMARDEYEQGVTLETLDTGDNPDTPEMPADFPNSVFAEVRRTLPRHRDHTVLEATPTMAPHDKCLRTRNSLINVTRMLASGATWDTRIDWLLPPDHRYLAGGCVDLILPNQHAPPECPHFLAMIHNGLDGDSERIECLRRYTGKILVNPIMHNIQRLLCMYGRAGAGKSTYIDALLRLVGYRNVHTMRAAEVSRFDNARLPGKRLLILSETGEDSKDDKFSPQCAALIKQVTSADPISCERKGFDAFMFRPTAEIITVSNPPPVIPMDRDAFLRRAVFLRWDRKIAKADPRIHDKIVTEELAGIFLWAMQGAACLHRIGDEGLVTPTACYSDLLDATEQVDPETHFVRSQLKAEPGTRTKVTDVAALYETWATICKIPPSTLNRRKIGQKVSSEFGINSHTARVGGESIRVYDGVAIIDPTLRKVREEHASVFF